MNEIKKGTLKREVGKVEIKGFEINRIILNTLLEKGYDLLSEPMLDSEERPIGERVTIYKIEKII